MQRNTILSLLIFSAVISASYSAWLVRTTAGKCGMTPFSVQAINGNCAFSGGAYAYKKITCDGSTATTYYCDTALCNTCKQGWTQQLGTCDSSGVVTQCFASQPDLSKFVGAKYITDSFYPLGTCNGDPSDIYASPRDTCVNIYGSASYSMSCKDNLVMYYGYNTSTCTGSPNQQFPNGPRNQCALSHYQQCY